MGQIILSANIYTVTIEPILVESIKQDPSDPTTCSPGLYLYFQSYILMGKYIKANEFGFQNMSWKFKCYSCFPNKPNDGYCALIIAENTQPYLFKWATLMPFLIYVFQYFICIYFSWLASDILQINTVSNDLWWYQYVAITGFFMATSSQLLFLLWQEYCII